MEEKKSFTNRLSKEKSPYLIQHAHNPVDWYPWGKEAFDTAKEQNKPIFLSIGYATCHWCHVMEQESFEDPEVAQALNDAFICIKIDREELPEIDGQYMELAQTMIWGSAGWPLNLILTPDLKPFFAATYLPKRSARGLVGIIELTEKMVELWRGEEQERLIAQAEKVVDILKAHVHVQGGELPTELPITQTAEILFKIADPIWGGMRGAPKFPLGYQANFLLRHFLRSQDSRALFLVEKTQEMMQRGGIYDHLGGGFHRYSTDEHWHVPHFEKMLYDNAILAYAYLETWRITHRPLYKETCQEILDYVAQEMRHPEGGFYSAEDADSEGIEGLFYTWTRQEVLKLLGDEIGHVICDFYGIYDHGIVDGRNVLYTSLSIEEFAQSRDLPVEEFHHLVRKARQVLLETRKKRIAPLKDDKIVTSWNGLMIHAFAEAGFYLERSDYSDLALKAAHFVQKHLTRDGRLMRRFRDGETRFGAGFDDYALLIRAYLSLYETGLGNYFLPLAEALAETAENEFKAVNGAFYQASEHEEHLLVRKCHFSDGAEPSGNAIHAENLLRLWQITGKSHYLTQAEDIFRATKRFIDSYPLGYCCHLIALERYFDPKKAVCVVSLNEKQEWLPEIRHALTQAKSPHVCRVFLTPEDHVFDKPCLDGKTTLYLCYDGVCKAPLNDKEAILKTVSEL